MNYIFDVCERIDAVTFNYCDLRLIIANINYGIACVRLGLIQDPEILSYIERESGNTYNRSKIIKITFRDLIEGFDFYHARINCIDE